MLFASIATEQSGTFAKYDKNRGGGGQLDCHCSLDTYNNERFFINVEINQNHYFTFSQSLRLDLE
jgi:hypothetical protein